MSATCFSGQRQLILLFCTLFAIASATTPAYAAMVTTDQLLAETDNLLVPPVSREVLQQKLVDMGVSVEDAQQRVATLSNQEVIEVAGAIDGEPAGGGALTVVAVIFLVLLWTDIMGYTDVFPFVNKSPNGSQGPVVTEN